MIIYPTLELLDGKCVTLTREQLDEPELWHIDPIETARSFAAAGAQWMHLTDLNGLRGDGNNNALVEDIIQAAGIPVQFASGFGTQAQVADWIGRGAGRIVVGTMAVHHPGLLHELAKFYPDQIILALDVHDGVVLSDRWRERSSFRPEGFIAAFEADPLAGIIVTDVGSLINERDASLGVISGLAASTRHPVIARGTVTSLDDVARLKYVANISGTLIGRALLARDVDLAEAIALANAPSEPVAAFK